jgi:hypothetical protein
MMSQANIPDLMDDLKWNKIRLHTPYPVFPYFIFQKHYMFRLSSAIIRRKQSKAKTKI